MKRAEAVKLIKDYGFAVLKHQNNWLGEAYEALLSALLAASAPTPSVEPVAWAVFSTNGYAKYVTTDKDEADKWIKDWSDVRPLYAAPLANPSDKQEAVAFENWIESVPPLTWESWGRREAAHAAWIAAPIAQSAEQEAKPAGYVNAAWAENRIGTTTVYPESRPRLATMPLFTHPTPDDAFVRGLKVAREFALYEATHGPNGHALSSIDAAIDAAMQADKEPT